MPAGPDIHQIQPVKSEPTLQIPSDAESKDVSMSLSQKSNFSELEDGLFALIPTQAFRTDSPQSSATLVAKSANSSDSSIAKQSTLTNIKKRSYVNDSPRPKKTLKMTHDNDDDDDDPFLPAKVHTEVPNVDIDEPYIIVHSRIHQASFTSRQIPYGAQYEIARLISEGHISFKDIAMERLDRLSRRTNVEAAPLTRRILLGREEQIDEKTKKLFENETLSKSPWAELDREEEAFRRHGNTAALGFTIPHSDWFGGKVIFRMTLKDKGTASKPSFKIFVEPAELGTSCRFSRRFGSTSFLRIKVHKNALRNESKLVGFLKRPFILLGSVYRSFFAKDSNVFLFKTNEIILERPDISVSSAEAFPGCLSLLDFLEWHNPLHLNANQTLTKWSSRSQLGLSTSAAGLLLEDSQILEISDIMSEQFSDMTDGAGLINKAALRQLYHKFSWESWPTAIQVRIKGAKGLLVQHTDDNDTIPKVWLRPSQMKIKYPSPLTDDAFRIIDVLRSSHSRASCRLSVETIINLCENKVPKAVFKTLLERTLDALVSSLTKWDDPDDMFELWVTVCRLGRVFAARSARQNTSLARVSGHAEREANELDEDEDDLQFDAVVDRSTAWWSDEVSGCPSSLEETVMYLIDAGFTPGNCAVLKEKLEKVLRKAIDSYIKTYRMELTMSCTAFLVPDETGTLEPGEVYYKSSRRNLVMADGTETDHILGDVLVTRHPCKLPTDVQKWTAVDRPELRNFTDVLVFSIKGLRRAADYLSGGDYDGDKGLIIYDPLLVGPFINAPLKFSNPPSDIGDYFIGKENRKSVADLLMEYPSPPNGIELVHELQDSLLGNLRDTSVVGKYSNMHENAIYTLGYRNPETIRLAYMFCMTLDGAKTGLKVKQEVLMRDQQKYGRGIMHWKGTIQTELTSMGKGSNEPTIHRPSSLGQFVMDYLSDVAKSQGDAAKVQLEKCFKEVKHSRDEDLIAPWLEAKRIAQLFQDEGCERRQKDLELIASHVEQMYAKHRDALNMGNSNSPRKGSPSKNGPAKFTELPIETRQDVIRSLSREFVSKPKPQEVLLEEASIAKLRASYAYYYDCQEKARYQGWTRFPWDCAMRDLCEIKAKTTGRWKTVQGDFYNRFMLKLQR